MERYGLNEMKLIYENPLSCEADIADFVLEGRALISFPEGKLRLENAMAAENGQKANYVLWCPREFPSDVCIEWDFQPIREPGLAMMFFAAKGRNGEDLFDGSLQKRTGEYVQYHHGDINAFHVSYFRRKEPDERAFHTCNLRKSYGFYLVSQGGDPIPDVADAHDMYRIGVVKKGADVLFYINELEVFHFADDGQTYGPLLTGGKIGFRQLAPMIGEYANLKVWEIR
ncbi:MAG: YesU family protein [Lachnospiraceae bacterium]|nr:YesU family protein [Lachnospiraceae bacterium]